MPASFSLFLPKRMRRRYASSTLSFSVQIVRLLLQLLHQRGGELAQLLRIHVRDVSGEFCRGSGPVHGAQYAGVGRCLPSGDFPVARGANP